MEFIILFAILLAVWFLWAISRSAKKAASPTAREVAGLVLFTVVAGCQTYWTKPGFNQADWNRESYECERDMRQSGYYGTGFIGLLNSQGFFERCLVGKGYYKTVSIEQYRVDQFTDPATVAPEGTPAYAFTQCQHRGDSTLDACMKEHGFLWNGTQWREGTR
jgi:hypothetical protein